MTGFDLGFLLGMVMGAMIVLGSVGFGYWLVRR